MDYFPDQVRAGFVRQRLGSGPAPIAADNAIFSGPGWQGPSRDRTVSLDNGVNVSSDHVAVLQQILGSQLGQSLPAGQFNALGGQLQNAYNQRAAATPGPWQAAYYQAQPQETSDTLSTGAEQQKLPWTPQMQSALGPLVRQFGSAQPRMSFGAAGNMLLANGQEYTADPNSGLTPIEQAKQHAMQTMGPARSEDDRWAQADAYLSRQGVSGLQKNQLLTHLFGEDPLSHEKRKHDWLQQAATFQDAHRKALFDEYQGWAKSAEGDPEDILSTYGKNPQLPSAYYRPGKNLSPDPMNPTEVRQIPGGWTNIGGATVQQLKRLRESLGLNDEAAQAGTAQAGTAQRRDYLLAKAGEERFHGAHAAAGSETLPTSMPAGLRHRQAIAAALQSVPERLQNATGAAFGDRDSATASALNYLRQLFGGSASAYAAPLSRDSETLFMGP